MLSTRRNLLALTLALGSGLAALTATRPTTASEPAPQRRYEIAMDGTSLSFEGDVNENGVPAKGTPFILHGYIYPEGTFARHGELSGTNPDGSPQFPEAVIGTWICRGWHLQDGDAPSGPVVATSQYFDLDLATPGSQSIVTDGIEMADFDLPFRRAVTGGTGMFAGLSGDCLQVYVGGGLNASGGFNTVIRF